MLDTSKIIPTHNRFRNPEKAKELIMVRDYCDYILNNQRGPIVLIQTEDDQLWCHDGHHRLAAVDYHYGEIDENYVEIKKYSYQQLNEINLSVSYVTPYDPRVECRLENFWMFKNWILNPNNLPEWKKHINTIIKTYHEEYKEQRRVHTLRELCNTILSSPLTIGQE